MPERISPTELGSIVREVLSETFKSLSNIVDVEARHGIASALQVIASHERICTERDKNADEQRALIRNKLDVIAIALESKVPKADIEEVKQKIDGLYRMLWGSLVSIMGVMAVVIGFLIKAEFFK